MGTSLDEANAMMPDLTVAAAAPQRRVPSRHLPAEPVTKIRPSRFWEKFDFAELWAHREVLYFLMWRDLKVRYKQTIIGVSWVFLQPILMTLVFTVFLGRFMGVPSDGVPYPIFAYAALLLWTFISNAVLSSSYSLVTSAQIITRVYFSRLLIPTSTVGVRLVDLIIASLFLLALMIYYRVPIGWSVIMLPVFVLEIAALAMALGILGAALNVRYRDVGTMLPILLQAWLFTSPIAYSLSIVPERLRFVYSLNPLVGIIGGFRSSLFNLPFHWPSIIASALITLPLLIISIRVFRAMESTFADEV